jgi:aminoglycoside phosphotransferase
MQLIASFGLPAPQVLHYSRGDDGTRDALLTTALEGVHGATPDALAHPQALAGCYADALRRIHDHSSLATSITASLPSTPSFDRRLEARVRAMEQRAQAGTCKGERLQAIREHLQKAPTNVESDMVFSHGDYCLPNVVLEISKTRVPDETAAGEGEVKLKVVGFVDLGEAGVGDRYRDLASAALQRANGPRRWLPPPLF